MIRSYTIVPAPDGELCLASPVWEGAAPLSVDQFHPRSSNHRPPTLARILHQRRHLLVRFEVTDRYVRSVSTQYQQLVCRDSCVELFVQPKAGLGYFNFEISCGGTLLLYYIEDHTRTPEGFAKFTPLPPELGRQVQIQSSLPPTVEPEISRPVCWSLACRIPLCILEPYIGPIAELPGQTWRGNLYKCADDTSHPHWASWSPVGADLNFHLPQRFGELHFT